MQRLIKGCRLILETYVGTFIGLLARDGRNMPSARSTAAVMESQRRGDPTTAVSYTHLRAHETREDLVCRLLLEKKKIRASIIIVDQSGSS